MGLDIKTLFVVDVAVLFMTAAVSFTLWVQHRDIAGLLWWSFATAAEGLAMLIVGLFGPVLPPTMGFPAALLFVGGFLMVWESMRRFNGRPAAKGRLLILLLGFAAVLVTALVMGATLQQRAGLLMLALAFCAAASAWEVTFGGTPPLLRSRFALTVVFSVIGVLLARQAILTGLLPSERLRDVLGRAAGRRPADDQLDRHSQPLLRPRDDGQRACEQPVSKARPDRRPDRLAEPAVSPRAGRTARPARPSSTVRPPAC